MRILLAEDEIPLARAIKKIFEKNNYSADAVHSGEDALMYLETGSYDAENGRHRRFKNASRQGR